MNRKAVIGITGIILLILVFTVVYFYKIRTRNAVEQFVQNNKLINVLLAADMDSSTDTNSFYAVISIHPENGNTGITFIPPNYVVSVDEIKGTAINTIDFDDNIDAVKDSIYRDIHLKISFFMQLYPTDVRRIIDLLEGIDLYILDQAKKVPGLNYGPWRSGCCSICSCWRRRSSRSATRRRTARPGSEYRATCGFHLRDL